jgi:hypothetical protein
VRAALAGAHRAASLEMSTVPVRPKALVGSISQTSDDAVIAGRSSAIVGPA